MKFLLRFYLAAIAVVFLARFALAEEAPALGDTPVLPSPTAVTAAELAGTTENLFYPTSKPPLLGNKLTTVVGFAYLRPAWGNQNFNIAVPNGTGGSSPSLGDARDVLHNFNFAPIVQIDYRFLPTTLGIRASGWAVNFAGNLDRTVTSPAGSGALHAQSTLGLSAVNLPEATTYCTCPRLPHDGQSNVFGDCCVADFSLGLRYSALTQTFDATALNGPNGANLHSDESFSGLGVTGALGGYCPLGSHFLLFANVRGSTLFGTNKRNSSFSTTAPSVASSAPAVLTDTKSSIVPVGELDLGIGWGRDIGASYDQKPPPVAYLSVGCTGQIWGNTAMISAASGPNFSENNLYLVGLILTLGFAY